MADAEKIAKTIGAVAEVIGHELSPMALKLMVRDMARYPEAQVIGALHRCARECRHRLTLADILERLDDGRPGVEEAWSMIPRSEAESAVLSDEMAEAMRVAQPLLDEGDAVAARMAFKEAYQVAVQRSRDDGVAVNWFPSLGHDPSGREGALTEAARKGRISYERAKQLIPDLRIPEEVKQLASDTANRLTADG